jgi:hypothetical protein
MNKTSIWKWIALILILGLGPGCQTGTPGVDSTAPPSTGISEIRKQVRHEPVATCQEKIDDPLNNWFFSVRLYETSKTFEYLMKMQFEEVKGEDTVVFPNLGFVPRPAIQKGKDKYSCIVGFMDGENKFREYKLIYVQDGKLLKSVTLHHYTMVQVPDAH